MSRLTVDAAAATHVGLVRRRNEDAVYAGRYLFAVADGLGGHTSGDVASSTVIDIMAGCDRHAEPAVLADILGRAIHRANQTLRSRIEREPELSGMGTTLVAMLWSGTTAVIANLGDSRVYRLRKGELVQLTEDHTYGNLLSRAASVPNLPEKIARFLDGRADGRSPDLTPRDLQAGDRFLLCSDGLSGVVPVDRIRDVLAETAGLDDAVEQLVAMALEAGGPDNITVVVAEVRDH